ncbi:MAG: hypothetical protein IAF58_19885 [Leptolyngbya sp.]|nr:hypothetical protein [Candidatus Melainabacteria bacterium]
MLTFMLLLASAFMAKLEQVFLPACLEAQKKWLIEHRFPSERDWFRKLCLEIPDVCPITQLGLPPMCKYSPLYDQWLLMKYKAVDLEHQDDYIKMAAASL